MGILVTLHKRDFYYRAFFCTAASLIAIWAFAQTPVKQPSSPTPHTSPTPLLRFGPPKNKPMPLNALDSLNSSFLPRRFVYIANIFPGEKSGGSVQKYIVLCRNEATKDSIAQSEKIVSYPIKAPFGVFSPQFSPDGQSVLFKGGQSADRYDRYIFFVWNLRTGEVQQAQQGLDRTLSYEFLSWSSDSRYIAYLLGGDRTGERDERDPLQLYTYNVNTGQKCFIAQDYWVHSLAWTYQHTLLYTTHTPRTVAKTINAPNQASDKQTESDRAESVAYRTDIYECSPNGSSPHLIIKDGFDPIPSPDGQWIAFRGWPQQRDQNVVRSSGQDAPKTGRTAYDVHLYLYHCGDQKRILISNNPGSSQLMQVVWTPDSLHLLRVEEVSEGTSGEAQVYSLEVPALTWHKVAVLRAKDSQDLPRDPSDPQFSILRASHDGQLLFLDINEIGLLQDGAYPSVDLLEAVNLQTGAKTTLFKSGELSGFDWHDGSVPKVH